MGGKIKKSKTAMQRFMRKNAIALMIVFAMLIGHMIPPLYVLAEMLGEEQIAGAYQQIVPFSYPQFVNQPVPAPQAPFSVPGISSFGWLRMGDYVAFTPTSSTHIVPAGLSGHTVDQTISTQATQWRVMNVLPDGRVQLISAAPLNILTLRGAIRI